MSSFNRYIRNPDDHIYYNALFNNDSGAQQQAYFTETRTSPILQNPSLYHLALIRFSIPTYALPIFPWPLLPNGSPNNNYYSFTFKYGATEFQSFLTYVSWALPSSTPGIYTPQNFLDICNQALYDGHQYMIVNAPSYPGVNPPYLVLDTSTSNISLIADTNFLCTDNISSGIKLYSDFYLHRFFEPLPHIAIQVSGSKNILYVIEPTGNNSVNSTPPIGVFGAITAYSMTTNYQVLQNWSALKSILVVSNSLKTKEEYVQTKRTLNQDSSLQIITDFEPNRLAPGSSREYQQYQADIYRYVDLTSTESIRTIDLQILWSDTNGNIYPLYINPGDYFTIKLLLTKKDSIH